jgi:N-acetylmuramoyl-L-alanine amidase
MAFAWLVYSSQAKEIGMAILRHAGSACLATLSLLLLCGVGHPAPSPQHARSAAKPAQAVCLRSAFRVIIDVGHTADVPGAVSARGVPEYAFNLSLAEDIDQVLVAAGFDRTVLLITAKPPPIGLAERTIRANTLPADLFISIHHDSVPDYLLETWENDGQQRHFSDRFKGYAIFISNDNIRRADSLLFGSLLGKALQARGLRYTPHYTLALMGHRRRTLVDASAGVYRYDELIVLRQTYMPAVLLEAGSIVNRQEELELASPERRAMIGAAVTAAVEDFCMARSVRHADRMARRPSSPERASAAAFGR